MSGRFVGWWRSKISLTFKVIGRGGVKCLKVSDPGAFWWKLAKVLGVFLEAPGRCFISFCCFVLFWEGFER